MAQPESPVTTGCLINHLQPTTQAESFVDLAHKTVTPSSSTRSPSSTKSIVVSADVAAEKPSFSSSWEELSICQNDIPLSNEATRGSIGAGHEESVPLEPGASVIPDFRKRVDSWITTLDQFCSPPASSLFSDEARDSDITATTSIANSASLSIAIPSDKSRPSSSASPSECHAPAPILIELPQDDQKDDQQPAPVDQAPKFTPGCHELLSLEIYRRSHRVQPVRSKIDDTPPGSRESTPDYDSREFPRDTSACAGWKPLLPDENGIRGLLFVSGVCAGSRPALGGDWSAFEEMAPPASKRPRLAMVGQVATVMKRRPVERAVPKGESTKNEPTTPAMDIDVDETPQLRLRPHEVVIPAVPPAANKTQIAAAAGHISINSSVPAPMDKLPPGWYSGAPLTHPSTSPFPFSHPYVQPSSYPMCGPGQLWTGFCCSFGPGFHPLPVQGGEAWRPTSVVPPGSTARQSISLLAPENGSPFINKFFPGPSSSQYPSSSQHPSQQRHPQQNSTTLALGVLPSGKQSAPLTTAQLREQAMKSQIMRRRVSAGSAMPANALGLFHGESSL